jgi:hypothetical protein
VLDTILKTIDSKIDRRRASERQVTGIDSMSEIHDFKRVSTYFLASPRLLDEAAHKSRED